MIPSWLIQLLPRFNSIKLLFWKSSSMISMAPSVWMLVIWLSSVILLIIAEIQVGNCVAIPEWLSERLRTLGFDVVTLEIQGL
jgi:hypothetical protein